MSKRMFVRVLVGSVLVSGVCGEIELAEGAQTTVGGRRVYYVDFEKGSDARAGTSPAAAFKRAPGDPRAAGRAGALKLAPGDTVLFKGGVVYRGGILVHASGAPGRPVTYDGNTEGKFGRGRAVIDGSVPVTDWKRCASAAVLSTSKGGGNPEWRSIYRADAPSETNPFLANLYQGGKMCSIAQDPNLKDPFYQDRHGEYRPFDTGKATAGSLVDPAYFTQRDPNAWSGAYVAVWAQPNYVYFQKVTGYEPAAHRILFSRLRTSHYKDRPGKYSMLNSLRVLDSPGEFVIRTANGRTRIYLRPHAGTDLARDGLSLSRLPWGFNLQGHGYIRIRGFTIRRFISRRGHRGAGITNDEGNPHGLVIRDNLILHCNKDPHSGWKHAGINLSGANNSVVENNRIVENRGCGGIYILGGEGNLVKGNLVRRNGYQGIWLMGTRTSRVIGNTVLDNRGTHSNGISTYSGCSNILISGNRVFNSNIPFTLQSSTGITLAHNVFHNGHFYVVADWGKCRDVKLYNNVLIRDDGRTPTHGHADHRNNIFVGAARPEGPDEGRNLHIPMAQMRRYFVDPEKRDFRLRRGSPAIDAGADVGMKTDAAGTAIPRGRAPDIGAYEYVPASEFE